MIPKARVWDLVAGAAILAEAGGELRYLSGDRIDYLELVDGRLAREAVIAGHPDLLDELSSLIRPRSLSNSVGDGRIQEDHYEDMSVSSS